MKIVDDFLNGITMYRLVLYLLIILILSAVVLSLAGLNPIKAEGIVSSTVILIISCWLTNKLFAKILNVPTNFESVYITALILALIFSPVNSLRELIFLSSTGVFAMASKYILTINRKHLFNPVAFAAFFMGLSFNYFPSWWVGTAPLSLITMLGGFLVVRKIQKFTMLFSFLFTSLFFTFLFSQFKYDFSGVIGNFFETPLLFFAFILLTEPQTTPPSKILQIIYGSLVGFLYAPKINFGFLYLSGELALLLGNIYSYIVSPKIKAFLTLKEKIQVSRDTYNFIFKKDKNLSFLPGQYMEWTEDISSPDNRGNRRYFTIASSPTEEDLLIGVKFYPKPSSFKRVLFSLKPGAKLLAGSLSGEFTLPKEKKKLCFIAGGIGITPFRSMIKFLLDRNLIMDVILLYSNKAYEDIAYKDIFDKASDKLKIKTVYILTDKTNLPKNWKGRIGYINPEMIQKEVQDFKERFFYISGPHSMVDSYEKVLKHMGISYKQVKVDFFPGYV